MKQSNYNLPKFIGVILKKVESSLIIYKAEYARFKTKEITDEPRDVVCTLLDKPVDHSLKNELEAKRYPFVLSITLQPCNQAKNMATTSTAVVPIMVFHLNTFYDAIIYFSDNTPAYLVKRFDVKPDGSKYQQEDFAQIAKVTEETHGKNYKYDLSYEEIGQLIKRHIPMYAVEIEKFFRLVLFNYIFSNGDAHVKNFSAIQTVDGDYVLTPAYDLLCTRIHSPNESDLALMLFKDRFTEAYDTQGFYTYDDFLEFGTVLGIKESRIIKIIEEFSGKEQGIDSLIDASFLSDAIKVFYKTTYKNKATRLKVRAKK